MRPRSRLAAALLSCLSGCDAGITDATCDRCDELRIRTERAEYRPGAVVRFSLTNLSPSMLRYDWCSVTLASRTSDERPFETIYQPARRCGRDAGLDAVVANMKRVEPGASVLDSLTIVVAYQGQQRVHVWLIHESGALEDGNPVASNTFDVYPGASTRLQRLTWPEGLTAMPHSTRFRPAVPGPRSRATVSPAALTKSGCLPRRPVPVQEPVQAGQGS